jgi:hypothetical protein
MLAITASPMKSEQQETAVRYSAKSSQNELRKSPPDYRIWRVLRPDNKGFALAFVSVSPDHFNRETMTELARLLNERFKRKDKVKAILFDDHVLAKNYASGTFDPTAMEDFVRGLYVLDRNKTEEYIQFSSGRNKPMNEITINLSTEHKKGL